MKEIKAILARPQVKGAVLATLTIAIGILSSITANNPRQWYWWIILIVVAAIYVTTIVCYYRLETSLNAELKENTVALNKAQQRIKAFSEAFQGVNAICKLSSKQTNLKIHEIIEQGKICCDNWNFEIASSLLCEQIYNHVICHICEKVEYNGIADIEVGYVSLIEAASRKKRTRSEQIKLCGYYHPSKANPSLYRTARSTSQKGEDGKLFHDGKLFREKKNENSILMTKEDIDANFGSLPKNHDYCQYIGVPIFCETVAGDNKMVGLLEVVCHNQSVISTNKQRVKDCIDLYLSTYAALFLLLFKNDKALRATPKHRCNEKN